MNRVIKKRGYGKPTHEEEQEIWRKKRFVVGIFKEDPYFKLALAPEGTRSTVKKWKTGFYYIAKGSNIPIVPCGLDFKRRTLYIAEEFYPGDDIESDMNLSLIHI